MMKFVEYEEDFEAMAVQPLNFYGNDDEKQRRRQQQQEKQNLIRQDEDEKSMPKGDMEKDRMRPLSIGLGGITGFSVQIISLGAYALMLLQHINRGEESHKHFETTMFSVLTQIDAVIFILIWIVFTITMTKCGMRLIRWQCGFSLSSHVVFVHAINFLAGIIIGAFVAWTFIDAYLGFVIPFTAIATTAIVNLTLCYAMVYCYEFGRGRGSSTNDYDDGEDDDDDDRESFASRC